MPYTVTTLPPCGGGVPPLPVTVRQDEPPTLEQLQAAVGGYIESLPVFDHYNGLACKVYVNEDGRVLRLPANMPATQLWAEQLSRNSDRAVATPIVVGPVVIIQGDTLEEFASL